MTKEEFSNLRQGQCIRFVGLGANWEDVGYERIMIVNTPLFNHEVICTVVWTHDGSWELGGRWEASLYYHDRYELMG